MGELPGSELISACCYAIMCWPPDRDADGRCTNCGHRCRPAGEVGEVARSRSRPFWTWPGELRARRAARRHVLPDAISGGADWMGLS